LDYNTTTGEYDFAIMYYRNRYYDTYTGRFTTQDPVVPIAIGCVIVSSIWTDIKKPYGGYPTTAMICGIAFVAFCIGCGSLIVCLQAN
jgi:hypothetical protein